MTMSTTSELDKTVERLLSSETFEADELVDVLVQKGHDKADVSAAIERAQVAIEREQQSPAALRAKAYGRRATRLIQIGLMVLVVGLVSTLYAGGGILGMLLIIAIGGGLVAAGYRTLKRGRRSS